MKPPFALSLSIDGIRLLHRAAGGWRAVGDVAVDTPDLASALGDLRARAAQLEPSGVRTKLVLPNDQIKYLTITTPDMDDGARRLAAEEALDAETPYTIEELAYDISAEGDETHIAAVARETLAEAEAFAVEHAFAPVCFAAIPGEQTYLGAPSFGVTAHAAVALAPGEEVDTDDIAVVVIGDVVFDDVENVQEPEVQEDIQVAEIAVEETAEDAAAATIVADTVDEVDEPQPEPTPEEIVESAPEIRVAPPTRPKGFIPPPEPPLGAPLLDEALLRTPEEEPQVGFSSRRLAEASRLSALGGALRRSGAAAPEGGNVTSGKIAVPAEAIPLPEFNDEEPPAGFLGLRARSEPIEASPSLVPALVGQDASEQDRMTVFGARQSQVGGKPPFLGLMLTTALLVFLVGVAAWASVFRENGLNLSQLFADRAPVHVPTDAPDDPVAEAANAVVEPVAPVSNVAETFVEIPQDPPAQEVRTAALDPTLTDEDTAVLDALSEPEMALPAVAMPSAPLVVPAPLTDAELDAKYATDGIWARAPLAPPTPLAQVDLENLYVTGIDRVSTSTDAVALPAVSGFGTDLILASVASPAPRGTQFKFGPDGRVLPTPEGALSPDGFTVYLGAPPLIPPPTPARLQTEPETEIEGIDTAARAALAAFRPQARPAGLSETIERAQLNGLSRSELAAFTPVNRPASFAALAAARAVEAALAAQAAAADTDAAVAAALNDPDPSASATSLAVAASLRPDTRPSSFAKAVRRAGQTAPQQETRVASAAAVAPRAVTPKIPSKASVAAAATTRNAINLNNVNLIGVYGKPSNRRALIRLSNGRYKKVVVGDRVDGGVVSAIGEGELRYNKRGRDLVLRMPK